MKREKKNYSNFVGNGVFGLIQSLDRAIDEFTKSQMWPVTYETK